MVAVSIGSLLPFIRDARMLSYAFTGLLVSLHSVGNLVASFVAGVLPLALGKKKSILLMNAFLAITYIIILIEGPTWLLAVAFFCSGLARGASSNFLNPYITSIAPGEASVINGLHASFCIGALIFPVIIMIITGKDPNAWVYACVFLIIIGIISWLLYVKLPVDNDKVVTKKAQSTELEKENDFGFLKDKLFYLILACLFFYLCAEQGVIGWMVSYFKDTGFLKEPFASATATIQWTMMLVGRLLTAYLSTVIDKRKLLPFMGVGIVGFFILLLTARSTVLIVIGIMGFGLSMAGIYPTVVSFAANIILDYPLGWSTMLTCASCGSILMPSIIGMVAEKMGIAYGMSTIVVAVCIELVALFVLIKATKNHKGYVRR